MNATKFIFITPTALIMLTGLMLTGCTTASSESTTNPSVSTPLVVADIQFAHSGGNNISRYRTGTAVIEGNLIVISNITNYQDMTRTETLRISIADQDENAAYTVTPPFIDIAATELNPDDTNNTTITIEDTDRKFTITPTRAGAEPIVYTIELRFKALEIVMLTPLIAEDISIDTTTHLAYAKASVLSVNGNIVQISGIKNREDSFTVDLVLAITDKSNPMSPEYTIAGGSTVTLPGGTDLNPAGITNTNTATNETHTFIVMPTGSDPVKYYVVLALGDLIELEMLNANEGGDLMDAVALREMSEPSTTPIIVKKCGIFPPAYPSSYNVVIGGITNTETTYTLTTPEVNSYEANSYPAGTLTLTGGLTMTTFSLPDVIISTCEVGDASMVFTETGDSSATAHIIDNDRKLKLVSDLVNSDAAYRGRHYRVTRDIDLSKPKAPWREMTGGAGFTPIGDTNTMGVVFGGTFDCEGNVISNLYINTNGSNKGLFGVVADTAMITNCGLANAKVTVTGASAPRVGSLVGFLNGGTVAKSYSDQAIVMTPDATADIPNFVGGLVGYNTGTITDSYSTGEVTNTGSATGGLVGVNSIGMIARSYSRVNVGGHSQVGGLAGNQSATTKIQNSYATGTVTASGDNVGGLVGFAGGTVRHSYATGQVTGTGNKVNGLIGAISGVAITASYWDTDTSGQTGANGAAIGITTGDLQVGAPSDTVYKDWDTGMNAGIWNFRDGEYPRLKTVACATRQYVTAFTGTCADIP